MSRRIRILISNQKVTQLRVPYLFLRYPVAIPQFRRQTQPTCKARNPSPDLPVGVGESVEFLSQSKSDSCVLDRIQAPSRRKRFRRQSCPSPFIPDAARKNPVSIPSWGSNYPSLSRQKQVPIPGGIIKEDPKLCADEWHNMPVCAQESLAERDYLPLCRPTTSNTSFAPPQNDRLPFTTGKICYPF